MVMTPTPVRPALTVMRTVAQEAQAHQGGLRGGATPAVPRRSGRGVVFAGRHEAGVQAR